MRIVAGQARGRRLAVPPGLEVRPTTDRVREALFSSLAAKVEGARVLDLFAGTGALGLEALSRGAELAVFVERSKRVAEILEANIASCGFCEKQRLVRADALRSLARFEAAGDEFDLVFLDPPYRGTLLARSLSALAGSRLMAPGTTIVAEHPAKAAPFVPQGLQIISVKRYAGAALSFFLRAEI